MPNRHFLVNARKTRSKDLKNQNFTCINLKNCKKVLKSVEVLVMKNEVC